MPRRILAASLAMLSLALVAAVAAPLLVQAGGGCHGNAGMVYTEGDSTVVKTDVCSFVPTVIRVPVGSAIRFLNSDDQDHQVMGRAGTWASDILEPGQEFDVTFTAKGTFPYACPLHPGMVGAVVVGDGIGLAGGAAVGQPETVIPNAAPAGSARAVVSPSASLASPAASIVATAPSRPTSAPAAPDASAVTIAAIVAGAGGVLLGAVVARVIAGRRRTGTATTR